MFYELLFVHVSTVDIPYFVLNKLIEVNYFQIDATYICVCVGRYVCRVRNRRRNYVAHAHAQSHFWAVKTDL